MRALTDAVWMILVGCVCAGFLWVSWNLADFRRPNSIRADTPIHPQSVAGTSLGVMPDVHWEDRSYSTSVPTSALPFKMSSYSMSGPEFLTDPAAAVAHSIAVGDVSGDGRDDLVFLSRRDAPNPANGQMEVYAAYQRVDGRLGPAVRIAESGNNLAYQLLVADLDRDGVDDVITAAGDGSGILLLRSNANGTFRSSVAVIGYHQDIVATDVDRDGHLDVLVDTSNTSATVVHGDGQGGIARISTLPLPSSAVRTTGDVTGDGLDDLILATIYDRPLQEFRVYPALLSGGYASPAVYYRPLDANQTSSIAVGDFNGDGRGDLVLDEAKDGAGLHLYFQDAQGNLVPSLGIARERGSSSNSLIATDLDRDGQTDLAIAHSGWGYIGYYLQTATGFTPETLVNAYQFQGRYTYFATGDLNHDGCGDLVIARSYSQSPVLLFGQGCALPRVSADCRYPAARVPGSGQQATRPASPVRVAPFGIMSTHLAEAPIPGEDARLGHDGLRIGSVPRGQADP